MATIVEASKDNHSKSSSSMALEGIAPPTASLKYNMTIEYYAANDLGAKIYINLLGIFAIRVKQGP